MVLWFLCSASPNRGSEAIERGKGVGGGVPPPMVGRILKCCISKWTSGQRKAIALEKTQFEHNCIGISGFLSNDLTLFLHPFSLLFPLHTGFARGFQWGKGVEGGVPLPRSGNF